MVKLHALLLLGMSSGKQKVMVCPVRFRKRDFFRVSERCSKGSGQLEKLMLAGVYGMDKRSLSLSTTMYKLHTIVFTRPATET